MNSTWDIQLIYRLIDLYRAKPVLWDKTKEEFKDRDKKNTAWDEIAQGLDMQRDVVERKMRILVFQFRRELMKPKMGHGVSKWFAYEKMLFLKEKWSHTQNTKTKIRCITPEVQAWNFPQISSTPAYSKKKIVELDKVDTCITTVPMSTKRSNHEHAKDDKSPETPKKVARTTEDGPARDQFEIFGEYVAAKLRSLNNSYASNTAQYHINNILYNADMGKYNFLERTENTIQEDIVKDENAADDNLTREEHNNMSHSSN